LIAPQGARTCPAITRFASGSNGDAEEAARFYASTFPDSSVVAIHRAPGDYPDGKEGDVLTFEFTVMGVPCLGLDGGPTFQHSEAFSFQVTTDDQTETDHLWDAIVHNGRQESACGWCKDKWFVVADHPPRPDRRPHRPGPRRRETRIQRDDGDVEDRYCDD
jgi:predicted 3-demethylubiquinone-9 3-methyltransferase (glyoxalase superfamily)